MVLQLKTGWLDTGYFHEKFGVDVWNEFRPVYEGLEEKELLRASQRNDLADASWAAWKWITSSSIFLNLN